MNFHIGSAALACVAIVAVCGCGKKQEAPAEQSDAHRPMVEQRSVPNVTRMDAPTPVTSNGTATAVQPSSVGATDAAGARSKPLEAASGRKMTAKSGLPAQPTDSQLDDFLNAPANSQPK